MASSLKYTPHRYGDVNYLQKLGVWEFDSPKNDKCWVVYIHGGAWRDPRVTHETFTPGIDHILAASSPSRTAAIAGFASIDYRLSAHPQFPQDPAATPPYEYRDAQHPDHLDDVRSALVFLQKQYGFGSNYVLLGHSAGAALAFQLLAAGSSTAAATASPALPRAVVAFEGIYDFTGINARFNGEYASFLAGAFGPPESWAAAAPIEFKGSYADDWQTAQGGRNFLMVASSPDDTLVDEIEAENMVRRLNERDGFREAAQGLRHEIVWLRDVVGDHDEIWEKGTEVGRMVGIALDKLGI